MIKIKTYPEEVRTKIFGVRPELWWALYNIEQLFKKYATWMVKDKIELSDLTAEINVQDITVTSLTDGKHGKHSLHYIGAGADVRIWADHPFGGIANIPQEILEKIKNKFEAAMGPDFDFVIEKSHIHIEYQPEY